MPSSPIRFDPQVVAGDARSLIRYMKMTADIVMKSRWSKMFDDIDPKRIQRRKASALAREAKEAAAKAKARAAKAKAAAKIKAEAGAAKIKAKAPKAKAQKANA